ncbi:hypothetical protein H3N56_05120 [Cetobacterium sp. 2A]|uniref:FomA family porin-like outer membrane protein n=1 Tax=Cetobacterium sp. 2A TaxID=2754723 RepID=UPI00163C7909|nr:hypothetical protein [Cetobacterium sp. 2A]MBC2855873.1 hypothetical protein [Cetobacterium sp. 2A]
MKEKFLLLSMVLLISNSVVMATDNSNIGKTMKKSYEKKLALENPETIEIEEEVVIEEIVPMRSEKGKEMVNTPMARVETRKKRVPKPFEPNGTIGFTQTFYGNSGKYKTATAHPSLTLDYNFAPKWSVTLEFDRLMNMYSGGYDGEEDQANNNFSSPQGQLTYSHGKLWDTDILWTTNVGARQYNYFTDTTNSVYTWVNMEFDFYKYMPDWVTKFALMPMYNYGFYPNSSSGHMNHASLNLLTQYKLPAGWSLQVDAFFFKEFYNGDFEVSGHEEANYFSFYAWLEYSKELYKFTDKTNLEFNFAGGFDPYTVSNKRGTGWAPPFWLLSNSYEWLSPTVTSSDENYNSIWTAFALPQLQVNYKYSDSLSMNMFVQVKYSNQVWGGNQKDWELQPQGGFGISYNF